MKHLENDFTDSFLERLLTLLSKDFSEDILLYARQCLLDYIGVTIAGAASNLNSTSKLLDQLGNPIGSCSIIGTTLKTSPLNAALINGINAHLLELDDGARFGSMHPGSSIISALLPLVESEKLTGIDLIKGIIIGYEAAISLSEILQPSHRDKGFHTTGTCGTIGAAIGCGVALKFNKEELRNCLAVAITGASGLLKVIEGESNLKPFNAGQAAMKGLLSVYMARAGYHGPEELLTGKRGFLTVYSNNTDFSRYVNNLSKYRIKQIYVKSYAACRHCHSPIEAAINLKNIEDYNIRDIKNVIVRTYRGAILGHDHTIISNENSAKMSIPYSVAVSLIYGKAGLDEFRLPVLKDKEVLALVKKIKVIEDVEITKKAPSIRAAILELNTYNNSTYSFRVDYPKGEPENFITHKELIQKVVNLLSSRKNTNNEITEMIDYILSIDSEDSFDYRRLHVSSFANKLL